MDNTSIPNLRLNAKKYLAILARNQNLNFTRIAKEVGISSIGSAYNVLSRLREKNLVDWDYRGSSGSIYLAEAGWHWIHENEHEINNILLKIEREKLDSACKLEFQKKDFREKIRFSISYLKEDDFDDKSGFLNFLSREVGCTKQDLYDNIDLWEKTAPPISNIKFKCYFDHKSFENQTLFLEWLSAETGMGVKTLKRYEDAWIDFAPEPQAGPRYSKLMRDRLRQQIQEMKEELEQRKLMHGRTDFMKWLSNATKHSDEFLRKNIDLWKEYQPPKLIDKE